MRKVSIAVLGLAVLGAGGYAGAWYLQANEAQKHIVQAIDTFNALGKANGDEQDAPHLTYDSITQSGFPANVYIDINKPRFKGRFDTLLKTMDAKQPEVLSARLPVKDIIAKLPEWREDITFDGTLRIGINVLSNEYEISSWGTMISRPAIAGTTYEMQSVSTEQNARTKCELKIAPSDKMRPLWDFQVLAQDPKNLGRAFRKLDCFIPGGTVINPTTKETLTTAGDMNFHVLTEPEANGKRTGSVYLKTTDTQASAGFDAIFKAYYKMFNKGDDSGAPQIAAYGKQNSLIDVKYHGPDPLSDTPSFDTFSLDVPSLNISSALSDMAMTAKIDHEGGAGYKGKAVLDLTSTFKPHYDDLLKTQIYGMVKELYNEQNTDPRAAQIKPFISAYTPDQLYAIVLPAVPSFESLGTMKQAVDVTYQATVDRKTGNLQLAKLNVDFTPYGLLANGSVTKVEQSSIPTGELTIACRNCDQLITDAGAYKQRIDKVLAYFMPQAAAAPADTAALTESTKSFIMALAGTAPAGTAPGTLVFHVKSDGAMATSVNGKSMDEVMGLYFQYMGKSQAQRAPAPMPDANTGSATGALPR